MTGKAVSSTLLDGHTFLEGARWHEGRLWVSDYHDHQVLSLGADGDVRVEADLGDGVPSGLGWLPDGRLLISSMEARTVVRREPSGELVVHANLWDLSPADTNDILVDPLGRAYVGSTGFDANAGAPIRPGPIILVQPDGTARVVAEDLYMPNGMTLVADNVLVVGETLGNRMTAFDIADDGSLVGRRAWATFGPAPATDDMTELFSTIVVAPDAISADESGAIWVADAFGNRAVRVAEGGQILEERSTGDQAAYGVVLGGDTGHSLFICVAPNPDMSERKRTRLGKLLVTTVDVSARVPGKTVTA